MPDPLGGPRAEDRPLRVLDLINTSESAKELLLDRALHLAGRYGVESHIACSDGPYVEPIRSRGVTVHVLETPRTMKPIALGPKPFSGAAVVHTVHGFHFHEGMKATERGLYEWVEQALLGLTDVTLSQNMEDYRIIQSWNPRGRAELIGNGIQIPAGDSVYTARRKAQYTLSCIARFEEVKNHRMLVDAVGRMQEAGVEVRLICFGKGDIQVDVEAYSRESGLESRIDFRGYVDDIFEHLADVDLNVLTSIKEGVPRALMESMALGIPSVCTDVKGSREVVVDGVTGRLVPVGDVEGFANAVIGLLEDPQTRQAMSEACVQRARERYDESRICDRLYDLYAGLRPAG